ncbi:MAG TPA: SAM-dependent methyltransferase, partial [Psychrobacter sp.]|nr:SAM-dependent methyltransferase [Psychrobacter sp.]
MIDNIEFTHQQARAFQPQRLSAPRDFMIPKIISDNKDEKPLILEIGAGKGKHALSFALQNPDKHLI